MTRFITLTTMALLLSCGSGFAQVGGMSIAPGPSPLGMTSPLGIGPGAPVSPTGIPLGATELSSLGVSPTTSGVSPSGVSTDSLTLCSGIGGSVPQASFGLGAGTTSNTSGALTGTSVGTGMSAAGTAMSTSVFDGGGTTGTASGTCATTGGSSLAGPAASASSPTGLGTTAVGRVGIPLGSTELGAGGLSPPPDVQSFSPPGSVSGSSAPCQANGNSSMGGMSTSLGSC